MAALFRARLAVRLAAAVLALLVSSQVWGSGLHIVPVGLTLNPDRPLGSFTVRNTGDRETVIQTEVVAWSQAGGEDVHTPSDVLLATPPIFTLAPGEQQIVRIGQRGRSRSAEEQAYRVIFQQVPPPAPAGLQGLQVALRAVVPVFVTPPGSGAELAWQVERVAGPRLRITAVNRGAAHSRLTEWRITRDADVPLAEGHGLRYLLPGARHSWTVPLEHALPAGSPVRVTIRTRRGEEHADVVVE